MGSQGISTADPADITATTLEFTALTASSRSIWLWGRRIWVRSRPSDSLISSRPMYSRTISAFWASSTALRRSSGSPGPERGEPGSKPATFRPKLPITSMALSSLVGLTTEEPAP